MSIGGSIVHVDNGRNGRQVNIWQKVNGGMRSVTLKRIVRKQTFLAGVLLYSCEGTRSLASGRVELANSSPGILRLYIRFMNELGFPTARLRARFQIHNAGEEPEAKTLWIKELRLSPGQFVKPLMSKSNEGIRRTFTLQLSYANSMLLNLLRYWTDTVEELFDFIGS
jgi:hypothetical protein